jgi:integrase
MAQRKRRLIPDVLDKEGNLKEPGEERRLLAASGPQLQRLIIAALETACRRGELLNLTWADVDLKRRELHVRAQHAKDREQRTLPISARLAGVLEMARTDPAGNEYPSDAYVFGELGRKIRSEKRSSDTAVLKAHGHQPHWTGSQLAPASRAGSVRSTCASTICAATRGPGLSRPDGPSIM